MYRLILLYSLLWTAVTAAGQASSASVFANWKPGEKVDYRIARQTVKVNSGDTLSKDRVYYDVGFEVTHQQFNAYNLTLTYKNFVFESGNTYWEIMSAVMNDRQVEITTDGMGSFRSIVNHEEIRDSVHATLLRLKAAYPDPRLVLTFNQIAGKFKSAESIYNTALEEIRQFFNFYGADYQLGEPQTTSSTLVNHFGGEPFSVEIIKALDEINIPEDYLVMRMWQTVDAEQMTNAAYQFMQEYVKQSGATLPPREAFPALKNETRSFSRISIGSGWVIQSTDINEVAGDNQLRIETRTIQRL
jgi:hypothetical protein